MISILEFLRVWNQLELDIAVRLLRRSSRVIRTSRHEEAEVLERVQAGLV